MIRDVGIIPQNNNLRINYLYLSYRKIRLRNQIRDCAIILNLFNISNVNNNQV